jgi:hypothetical protein
LPTPEPPPRPRKESLVDWYLGGDLGYLEQDLAARPAHYTTEHHELVRRLRSGEHVAPALANDLMLQAMRRTDAQKLERRVKHRLTADLITPSDDPPPFEDQQLFQGAIKLI